MNTITAIVHVHQLEPGRHISRKTVQHNVVPPVTYELPLEECEEVRPDWGVYHPVQTFPALERALRRRGAFDSVIGPDCEFSYGFVSQ